MSTLNGISEYLRMKESESVSQSVMSDSLRPHGLSTEFSRREYWNGLPFPFPGDLPDSRVEPGSPALQADSLPSELPGKPPMKRRTHAILIGC